MKSSQMGLILLIVRVLISQSAVAESYDGLRFLADNRASKEVLERVGVADAQLLVWDGAVEKDVLGVNYYAFQLRVTETGRILDDFYVFKNTRSGVLEILDVTPMAIRRYMECSGFDRLNAAHRRALAELLSRVSFSKSLLIDSSGSRLLEALGSNKRALEGLKEFVQIPVRKNDKGEVVLKFCALDESGDVQRANLVIEGEQKGTLTFQNPLHLDGIVLPWSSAERPK